MGSPGILGVPAPEAACSPAETQVTSERHTPGYPASSGAAGVSTTSPTSCPKCSAPYRDLAWTGGSPPYGPEYWQCSACGHEWATPAVRTTADAKLTRECERIRAAQRAGEITKAECASQIEAAHARRDASVAGTR